MCFCPSKLLRQVKSPETSTKSFKTVISLSCLDKNFCPSQKALMPSIFSEMYLHSFRISQNIFTIQSNLECH